MQVSLRAGDEVIMEDCLLHYWESAGAWTGFIMTEISTLNGKLEQVLGADLRVVQGTLLVRKVEGASIRRIGNSYRLDLIGKALK